MKSLTLVFLSLFLASGLAAQTPSPVKDPALELARMRKLADGLHYQQGDITLAGGIATISVSKEFRFLDAQGAQVVLAAIWHNPRAQSLGMLVPADFDPLSNPTWAVDITYADDGYVKDDDAKDIDYTKMLADMKAAIAEGNKEREKQGYPAIDLIGWAAPPRYDASTHKLYWAKELRFANDSEHTLNYNIRILGRSGVLVLNVIAGMPERAQVEKAAPKLLSIVNFQDGHRYTDFDSSTDKIATYGLAALVAGGIAAKAGLFKVILVAILAAKKFILMAIFACAAYFRKLFGRRKPESGSPAPIEPLAHPAGTGGGDASSSNPPPAEPPPAPPA